MLAMINGIDITDYINEKTYKMNQGKVYESWQDGNYREHRIYTRTRITGSFEVALYGKNAMLTQDFLDLWNSAVNNNVITILVYVQNTNKNELIEAYYEFEGTFHRKLLNGKYCDVLNVTIEER